VQLQGHLGITVIPCTKLLNRPSINPVIQPSHQPCLSINPSIDAAIHQSINPSIHQSINPSIHQSINPSSDFVNRQLQQVIKSLFIPLQGLAAMSLAMSGLSSSTLDHSPTVASSSRNAWCFEVLNPRPFRHNHLNKLYPPVWTTRISIACSIVTRHADSG
jgi:hypothetical protein